MDLTHFSLELPFKQQAAPGNGVLPWRTFRYDNQE